MSFKKKNISKKLISPKITSSKTTKFLKKNKDSKSNKVLKKIKDLKPNLKSKPQSASQAIELIDKLYREVQNLLFEYDNNDADILRSYELLGEWFGYKKWIEKCIEKINRRKGLDHKKN